jgi:hypothetical protein
MLGYAMNIAQTTNRPELAKEISQMANIPSAPIGR